MGNRVTRRGFLAATGAAGVALSAAPAVSALEAAEPGERPDLVVHHGKIVTVDPEFRIAEAMAVAGERILAVGANDEILKLAQPGVQQIDLQGKTVLPGLIDSHMHPIDAAMYEFDHPVPDMESITDVLDYVRSRAAVLPAGAWIAVEQVFITRLRERRFPTRQELDQAAPKHPVCFSTGPDASLNSLALSLSGIDRNFKVTDGQQGFIERDSAGEPTGIVRNGSRFIKIKSSRKTPGAQDRLDRVKSLLAAYNEVGITSVGDRSISFDAIPIYQDLLDRGQLTCRIFLSVECDAHASLQAIEAKIQTLASHPLHEYNNRLWLRGTKVYLDGGMLTGTAYMRKPWGVSKIYSITDPEYRGLLFIEPQRLYEVFRLSLANGLQTSAQRRRRRGPRDARRLRTDRSGDARPLAAPLHLPLEFHEHGSDRENAGTRGRRRLAAGLALHGRSDAVGQLRGRAAGLVPALPHALRARRRRGRRLGPHAENGPPPVDQLLRSLPGHVDYAHAGRDGPVRRCTPSNA